MPEPVAIQDYTTAALTFRPTDPHCPLPLATCRDVYRTTTTLWSPSFSQLCSQFAERPAVSATKQGPVFIVGPCAGTRKDANLPYASVAVLDADSTLREDGTRETGAPDPQVVHQQLVSWGISHLLFTTYSHGTKGHRYRILFPVTLHSKAEQAGFLTYMTYALQTVGIPVALTPESLVWSQPWLLPLAASHTAPYFSAYHIGHLPDPGYLAYCYGLVDRYGDPIRHEAAIQAAAAWRSPKENRNSLSWIWNSLYPLTEVLEMFDYQYVGQQAVVTESGDTQVVSRWAKPGGSANGAGVLVFASPGEGRELVYSHHTNDPLANGHANDSYAAFQLLLGKNHAEFLVDAVTQIEIRTAEQMNRTYPAIAVGMSKFKIGLRGVDDFGGVVYGLMDPSSFCAYLAAEPMMPVLETDKADGGRTAKFIQRSDWWLHSDKRIPYRALVYEPCPILSAVAQPVWRHERGCVPEPYFNTFVGWGIEPRQGAWDLLAWHLRETICGGIQDEYEYLLDWFAHLVQFPDNKPGVALVLRGGKGWGKSIVFQQLVSRMGSNAIVLGNNKQLTGQFNAHLRNRMLVVVEESFFAAHHQQEGVLKHLITDEATTFEAKGVDPVQGRSVLRAVLITNSALAAPASRDERRYFIPSVCDASLRRDIIGGRKGHFFPPLLEEMEQGGIEAFLWDVAHRPVSTSSVRNVPETPGLSQQRALMLEGIESWFYEALAAGEVLLPNGQVMQWGTTGMTLRDVELVAMIKGSLDSYSRQRNPSFRVDQAVREIFAGRTVRDGAMRRFPGLQESRRLFAAYTNISDLCFVNRPPL